MNEIKNIPTKYKGIEFRSRLEARWAYYWDLIGLEWMYEFEGFDLDGEWYLPDFYIPKWGYIEIKPEGGVTEDALRKATLMPVRTAIYEGPPSLKIQRGMGGEIFCLYSCSKWKQTPFCSGRAIGEIGIEDDEEQPLVDLANIKRFV
jgi:hypothetical protein